MNSRVPILTYHSVDDSGSVLSTAPLRFRSQMKTLKERGLQVLPLSALAACLRKKEPLPPQSVVITFDDGFKSFYQEAFPILQPLGFPATVFLVPHYVGRSSEWNARLDGMPVLDLLEWGEIEMMAGHGIDFGAHSMTHADLSKRPLEEVREEILRSKAGIEKRLGREVLFFSYPFGALNGEVKAIVKKEFQGACGTRMDYVSMRSDIYELGRIDMFYFSRNSLFRYAGSPAFSLYVAFRKVLRDMALRARSATQTQ